jgi:glycosyltransferase involved in cell wall biosynthesis
MTRAAGAKTRVLLYVNQVYPDDYTGQGTFERELIATLRRRVQEQQRGRLRVFTVRRPGDGTEQNQPASDVVALPLDKTRRLGYLVHQLRLLAALGRAVLQHRDDDVTIYARYAPSSVAPVALASLLRRRLVLRTGPALRDRTTFGDNPGPLMHFAVRLGFWCNCRRADAIVVVTTQTQRTIAASFPFVNDKTVVIGNGANTEHFVPRPPQRADWGLGEGGLVLGFVGHVYEDSGLDTVIRALSRVQAETGSAPQMLVVGDGPCLGMWKALAREVGVSSRIVFAGQHPYARIPSAIAACDVMLAPFTKRAFEVTGSSFLKLFEYLACDKPIMAARAPDHQFLAESEVGYLVEPEDVQAWSTAIRHRMAVPGNGLQGRGRRLVESQHSFSQVADRIWDACFGPAADHKRTITRGIGHGHG